MPIAWAREDRRYTGRATRGLRVHRTARDDDQPPGYGASVNQFRRPMVAALRRVARIDRGDGLRAFGAGGYGQPYPGACPVPTTPGRSRRLPPSGPRSNALTRSRRRRTGSETGPCRGHTPQYRPRRRPRRGRGLYQRVYRRVRASRTAPINAAPLATGSVLAPRQRELDLQSLAAEIGCQIREPRVNPACRFLAGSAVRSSLRWSAACSPPRAAGSMAGRGRHGAGRRDRA